MTFFREGSKMPVIVGLSLIMLGVAATITNVAQVPYLWTVIMLVGAGIVVFDAMIIRC